MVSLLEHFEGEVVEDALLLPGPRVPAVARAASFCLTTLGWTLEEVSADDDLHHWRVLRTSRIPDARPFDYYVDF